MRRTESCLILKLCLEVPPYHLRREGYPCDGLSEEIRVR